MAWTPRLGRGEADSVALAVQLGAQQVVIDDLDAAALAAEARQV
jgi:predicted nucleic acid-binding protein